MQPAVFIARLVGPAFVVVGLGILLNGPFYTAMLAEAVRSPTLIYLSGLMSLIRRPRHPQRAPDMDVATGGSSSPFSAGCW